MRTEEPLGTREQVIEVAPQAVAERVLALVTPADQLAAAGAPGLALRAAPRRRSRPALRGAARARADGRGARAARGARAGSPRCSARGCWSRRATTSPTVAAAVAAERGTTYVLIGQPPIRTGLGRLRESLPERLIRKAPGVDVRIVADRSLLEERGE